MNKFKPMGVYLSVIKDEPPKENEFGLEVPDAISRNQRTGLVLSLPLKDKTNEHLFMEDGSFCNLLEGDKIIFMEHAGVHFNGVYFLKINDILAKTEL